MTYPPVHDRQPRVPAVVAGAAGLMLAGAVFTAAWIASRALHATHQPAGPYSMPAWFGLAYLSVLGVVGCGPWLWMAWKTLAGRGWARYVSLVLLGVYYVAFIPALIRSPGSLGIVAAVGAELLVGYAAIVLQWLPASSRFFRAARQARGG